MLRAVAGGGGGGSATAVGPFPVTVSGTVTSGGIPYFNSTTQMSSSALLGANQVVLGGGAGAAPSSSSNLTYATGTLTVAGGANASVFASTGYSLTGSNAQSMVDLAGTVNTSGRFDIVKIAPTQTAFGINSSYVSFLSGSAYRVRFPVGTTGGVQFFNAYTDESNHERGYIQWGSNVFRIGTEAAGTGSARALSLFSSSTIQLAPDGGGTTRLSVGTNATFTANVLFSATNTYNIGAPGNATAPATIYAATGFVGGPVAINANVTSIAATAPIYLAGTGTALSAFVNYGADAGISQIVGFKTRAATTAATTAVQSGDLLLGIVGVGADGSAYRSGGYIRLYVDGTPGSSDMPGRWEFGVTPDGSATPATALTINNDKSAVFANFIAGTEQTAPAAPAADGYRIFAQDNGAGKTQLMVIFASGAAQQIAIEP